jgi:dolichol-phosphate mannosyltransferase
LTYPVRLIVRAKPRKGLSGAVLEGLATAAGEYVLVMDADLQHSRESLPALLGPLERNEADFALGSRYVPGASTEEAWGALRRLNSWAATLLARPFAKHTSDPMSGFFALPRSTYQRARRLTPTGYKIGLERMCKCRVERIAEVPIHFGTRARGGSSTRAGSHGLCACGELPTSAAAATQHLHAILPW